MSGFLTRGWQNSRIISCKVSTSQLDKTSTTSASVVPGLQHKLLGGKTYIFRAVLTGTSGASGGAKFAIAGDSTLTATQYVANGKNYNGTTLNANSITTTLSNAVAAATAVFTDVIIEGSIVVNVPGVLGVFMAQNVSNGTTSSVYVGSSFVLIPID